MMRLVQLPLVGCLVLLLCAFGCGAGGNTTATAPADSTGAGDNTGEGSGTTGATVPTFDRQSAWADLLAQVAFGPRSPGSSGYDQCRAWLVETLGKLTGDVVEQTFEFRAATGQTFIGTNILATFQSAASSNSGILLLGAHWDTRPVADQDPDPARRDQPILGANDGASGVAVLLELARAFSASPPPRPIVIALFDWEDAGLTSLTTGEPNSGFSVGARRFAEQMGRFAPTEAVIVDMVGDANLHLPIEPFSQNANPGLVNQLWGAARALGFTQFDDRVGGAITDDHLPLIEAGVKAIDVIDLDYPGPNSNHFWHTHADVPENCSADSLQAVGQSLLQVIYGSRRR